MSVSVSVSDAIGYKIRSWLLACLLASEGKIQHVWVSKGIHPSKLKKKKKIPPSFLPSFLPFCLIYLTYLSTIPYMSYSLTYHDMNE